MTHHLLDPTVHNLNDVIQVKEVKDTLHAVGDSITTS